MVAYKCDCCGALYESYTTVELGQHSCNEESICVNSLILCRHTTAETRHVKSYDLCPSCMKIILEILKNTKEEL